MQERCDLVSDPTCDIRCTAQHVICCVQYVGDLASDIAGQLDTGGNSRWDAIQDSNNLALKIGDGRGGVGEYGGGISNH